MKPMSATGNPDHLISLAEASARTGRMIRRGTFSELPSAAPPTLDDLAHSLLFALGDGRIWLNDQRMVLIQSQVLGALRAELIDTLGMERAKALLMRIGYLQGVRAAELVLDRFAGASITQLLAAGPRVHTMEGFVKVTTRHFEFDADKGTYHGEFVWEDSSEAAEHHASHGLAQEPVCWMQTGVPSGYTSRILGHPVFFREIECAGMGAPHCLVVGRDAVAWGKDAPEQEYFGLSWRGRSAAASSKGPSTETAAAEPETQGPSGMVGVSASFQRACHLLEKVATTDATVLFIGESGVGKELFSSQLHQLGRRSKAPFIAINCAAIPDNLVESELFGVEKGAYTGAVAARPGYFERAEGGTLFLDEIASLTFSAQGKLLRAIQERTIERLGGTRSIAVNVRIVAASNVDLAQEVSAGRFRRDLYYRLNVCPIHIPPLRERRDDIPLLCAHFLAQFREKHGKAITGFSRSTMDALLAYDFPGNIRELQNLVERGVVFADDNGLIGLHHVFQGSGRPAGPVPVLHTAPGKLPPSAPMDGLEHIKAQERALYSDALTQEKGNISAAARRLGLTRARLEYRLRKHGLI